MQAFTVVQGIAAPLAQHNIDTDQLLPARFLKKPRGPGYGNYLLHDLRYREDGTERGDFVLNQPPWRDAVHLLAGRNFGGGSSREGAVYALVDYGIRTVIAESFGEIFAANAARNGLLTATVSATDRALLSKAVGHDPWLRVDLETCRITTAGQRTVVFGVAPAIRQRLLQGLDDIDLTLSHAEDIEAYVHEHRQQEPWRLAPRRNPSTADGT